MREPSPHKASPIAGQDANGPVQGCTTTEGVPGHEAVGTKTSPFFRVPHGALEASGDCRADRLKRVRHKVPDAGRVRPATPAELRELRAALHA